MSPQWELELPLWQMQSGQPLPEQANLNELLAQVEGAMAAMSDQEQLQWAGEALLQITELWALRAEGLLRQWEENDRDPRVSAGFFADVVRQTMAVDLSELIEPAPPRQTRTKGNKPAKPGAGTIVAPVERAAVLAMVEQMEQEAALQKQVLAIADDEYLWQWTESIAQWLQAALSDRVSLAQLAQRLKLSTVEVWLAVLWGGFELEPQEQEEFYGQTLWVKGASSS